MSPLLALLLITLLRPEIVSAQIVEFYHLDVVGNVPAVTDVAGAVVEQHDYLPFGEEWCGNQVCGSVTAGQPKRFTGRERDAETGFDYFGARYYGSRIGRFTTVDPVLDAKGALFNPQKWNRYAYGLNNPLRYIDPEGRVERTPIDARLIAQERARSGYVERGSGSFLLDTVLPAAGLALAAAPVAALGIELGPAYAIEAQIAAGACVASAGCQNVVRGVAEGASGAAPGTLGTLPAFSASTIATAVESAAEAGRSAAPRGLRMLASHVDRGDPSFAGVEKTLGSAQGLIRNILQDPARVAAGRVTVDAYNAAGQGVRLEAGSGRFVTFLDASKATR